MPAIAGHKQLYAQACAGTEIIMTLKDIAEKAGVSMMTVSNVINGKHSRVSAKTIDKVNAIIKEYNYVPNLTARSLTAKSSHIVGVVVPLAADEGNKNYFENPYISAMMGSIERSLREAGYYAMIRSVKNYEDISALLRNWNVDGILFLYPRVDSDFNKMIDSVVHDNPIPIVLFDSPSKNPDIITICSDDQKGCYLSTKYLINHGHKNIAIAADYEGNPLLTARFNGYKKALFENNIPLKSEYIYKYAPTYEDGIEAGKKIASDKYPITAVVTTADICAIGIMEGARLGGLRVPTDLSVIGYDNLKLCSYTTPKLTTVSQHIAAKAETAVNMLIEKMQTGTINPSRMLLDVELIERQSVSSLI